MLKNIFVGCIKICTLSSFTHVSLEIKTKTNCWVFTLEQLIVNTNVTGKNTFSLCKLTYSYAKMTYYLSYFLNVAGKIKQTLTNIPFLYYSSK